MLGSVNWHKLWEKCPPVPRPNPPALSSIEAPPRVQTFGVNVVLPTSRAAMVRGLLL